MKSVLKITASYLIITLVALMVALNYQLFVLPNTFAPAGLNGLFTMLQYVCGFKISYATILINVPLAIASFFINSKPRALRSLTYSVMFSVFLMVFEKIDLSAFAYATVNSRLLGPLVAGLITGFGGYVMHKLNACYGGTEFIAGFIHKYKPHINFFNIIFVLNISVALISYFVYGYQIEPVLMCIIYSFASSSVRDTLSRRNESALRCEIVTEQPQQLSSALISQLHHTTTVISGKGAFSGEEKSILLCIINSAQLTELTKLVSQYPGSFVIVSEVTKVIGNFKRLDSHGERPVQLYDDGTGRKTK